MSEPVDSDPEVVFGNLKTQDYAIPLPNSTVKPTFGEQYVSDDLHPLLEQAEDMFPSLPVLSTHSLGGPLGTEISLTRRNEGDHTLCDDEDTMFCSPLPNIELDLEEEDIDQLPDFEPTSSPVPLDQPTMQTSTDDRKEFDFNEMEENVPVVISNLSPGIVRLSDLHGVFIFFLLICSSIIIILWVMLAYVYVINLVLMKIRVSSSSSIPSETCNTGSSSSNV